MLDTGPESDLERLAAAAVAYVQQSFAIDLRLSPYAPAGLPHFLGDGYRFWTGGLHGMAVTLMSAIPDAHGLAGDIVRHCELVRGHVETPVVLLLADPPSALRRRLIERKIGFVAPGTQIYLPDLLLNRQERASFRLTRQPDALSPTAQMFVIAVLLGEPIDYASLTAIADRFGISIMSVSRALDELEALDIAKARFFGRQRRLDWQVGGGELWHAIAGRLRSPVRKVRTVAGHLPWTAAPRAGLSALAIYTDLAPPRIERRAVLAAAWKSVATDHQLALSSSHDPDSFEVETWSYDPLLLHRETDEVVDPLSLYLALRDDPDERVAQAVSCLLEPFGWS